MNQNFIPFALPDIGQEEIDSVVETMKSGWITTGNKTKLFEKKFTDYIVNYNPSINIDSLQSISVNSATAGLHLALEACGIGLDDEVIVPTLTFTATAEVVRYLGAHPVFVDSDPNTLNIDIKQIESKITNRTKAIIPVHFAGLACDMDKIIAIAKKYNLKVIEDAAHALPATSNGKIIGLHESDAIVYSFYATKTITTGEGGMIVTRNPKIAERCRVMRLHGINRDAFDRYTTNKPSWYYEIVAPGYKYNLTDIASSIGIAQLLKANKFQARRQKIAEYYLQEFSNLPIQMPPVAQSEDIHSWHLFCMSIKPDARINRETFIKNMLDNGVGMSVHFIPLHLQPYWKETYKLDETHFPCSDNYYQGACSLPIYTKLTDTQVEQIAISVKSSIS
jgi:dTDP-4-amino-4,6-dideoxygalactose transaminase